MSRRWPPRKLAELAARRPYKGDNKRQKWEYCCAECGQFFKQKDIEVDHIEPCGTLKTYEDLPGFVQRLFCEIEGFRVACKGCHNKKTHGTT